MNSYEKMIFDKTHKRPSCEHGVTFKLKCRVCETEKSKARATEHTAKRGSLTCQKQ